MQYHEPPAKGTTLMELSNRAFRPHKGGQTPMQSYGGKELSNIRTQQHRASEVKLYPVDVESRGKNRDLVWLWMGHLPDQHQYH